jgi:hypothetical protein
MKCSLLTCYNRHNVQKFRPGSIPGGSLKRSAPLSEVEWVGDGNAPKTAQPSPNPLDLRLPPADMEPQINVTRNLSYLNQAEVSLHSNGNTSHNGE